MNIEQKNEQAEGEIQSPDIAIKIQATMLEDIEGKENKLQWIEQNAKRVRDILENDKNLIKKYVDDPKGVIQTIKQKLYH